MKVYVVLVHGNNCGNPFYCVIGVYYHLRDAQYAMRVEVKAMQKEWGKFINFSNKDEWWQDRTSRHFHGFMENHSFEFISQVLEFEIE